MSRVNKSGVPDDFIPNVRASFDRFQVREVAHYNGRTLLIKPADRFTFLSRYWGEHSHKSPGITRRRVSPFYEYGNYGYANRLFSQWGRVRNSIDLEQLTLLGEEGRSLAGRS